MKLSEVARRLGATLTPGAIAAIADVADVEISGVVGIEEAGPGTITFVANQRYAALARSTQASAILVQNDFPAIAAATLRVPDPYLAFAHAIELFYQPPMYAPGIHPTAVIAPSARIGEGAHIGAYVCGRGARSDWARRNLAPARCDLPACCCRKHLIAHAHAIVRERCRLGDHVILQNGAIVGADGFGFARINAGSGEHGWHKIMQSGPAVLEDHVEVQANACIDRASIGETRIRLGAKIDNLVQVGHGSEVGENSLLCAQVGLAGSTVIGRNVTLAGQVGVAGHCTVGDGAIATAQSGIPNDVAPGKIVSGYPAVDNRQWLRSVALFNRLPELLKGLRGR